MSLEKLKILIVDDELVSRSKMTKILESIGECFAVDNGKDAIKIYQEEADKKAPFNLITLDVNMPEVDGTQVLFEIREFEDSGKVGNMERAKILMVTAASDKDTVITSIQAGCDGYIIKPFTKESVFNKLLEPNKKSKEKVNPFEEIYKQKANREL